MINFLPACLFVFLLLFSYTHLTQCRCCGPRFIRWDPHFALFLLQGKVGFFVIALSPSALAAKSLPVAHCDTNNHCQFFLMVQHDLHCNVKRCNTQHYMPLTLRHENKQWIYNTAHSDEQNVWLNLTLAVCQKVMIEKVKSYHIL